MDNYNTVNPNASFDWDTPVTSSDEFTTLPEGTYPFTVKMVERGEYQPKPGAKLPACKKAMVTLEIDGGALGVATVKENLFFVQSQAWKSRDLLRSVGAIAPDAEQFVANQLLQLAGRRGMCELGTRRGDQGGVFNQVQKYLKPSDNPPAPAPSAPTGYGGYAPGQF